MEVKREDPPREWRQRVTANLRGTHCMLLGGSPAAWARRIDFSIIGLMEFARGGLYLVLLPIYLREQLHFPLRTIGLTISAFALTELILKVPAGMLVDRAGRRFALNTGVALSVVALLILSRVHTTSWILLGSALFGAGFAPIWPAIFSGVSGRDGGEGAVMGGIFTAALGGVGIGTAATAQLLIAGTSMAFAGLLAAVALSFVFVTAFVPPGPRAGARRHFVAAAAWPAVKWAFGRLYPLLLGMFFQALAMGMLIPILAPYARTVLRLSSAQLALLFAAGPGLTIVLLLPLGRLGDKLGPTRVVAGGVLVAPLGPLVIPSCGTLLCLVPLAAAIGAVYAMVLPAWNAMLLKRIPEQNKGLILGLAMALEGLGGALGPTAGGHLADSLGFRAPFYAASAAFAGIALFYFIFLLIAARTEARPARTRAKIQL